jgi:hypothetical protein
VTESKPAQSSPKRAQPSVDPYRVPVGNAWDNAWKVSAVVAVVGILALGFGYGSDPHRFAFSWLFAFIAFLTIALGNVFFVFISYLTGASWSVSVRRVAEIAGAAIPVFAVLFIPVWFSRYELYEWAQLELAERAAEHEIHGDAGDGLLAPDVAHAQDHAHEPGEAHGEEHGAGHGDAHAEHTPQHALHVELMEHKTHSWLTSERIGIASFLYFIIWTLLAWFYFWRSTEQDLSKDPRHTVILKRFAPISAIVFGLSLTYAGFDWVMSLEPTWYSTIYGVYLFAGTVISGFSFLILLTMGMKSKGLLGNAVNVEHYHDISKLTFGFIVFWAYVGASQMLLIWYANIPEETVYYYYRWHVQGWKGVSIALILGHFFLPFVFLMSRQVKRRLPLLAFGCTWMIVMHIVDIYWFVMPNVDRTKLSAHWMDIAALLAVGGSYFTVVFFMLRRYPLIPIGDPRLHRSLSHEST